MIRLGNIWKKKNKNEGENLLFLSAYSRANCIKIYQFFVDLLYTIVYNIDSKKERKQYEQN